MNLKIALQPLVVSRALTTDERNELLGELADDVAALVLAHNRDQSRAISRDQRRSTVQLGEFREMMTDLEATGLLDRALEGLPDRETLRARRASFLGLTRPELAVLLAYAKMHATRLLAGDAVCEDPHLERVLLAYFPPRLIARCRDAIRVHRLRREIIATTLTNGIVDLMGATFFTRTMRESGATAAEIARAFVVIDALTDGAAFAARAHEASPAGEARFLDTLVAALERTVRWLLATYPSIGPLDAMIDRFQDGLATAERELPPSERERRAARAATLVAAEVPSALAEACVRIEGLPTALDVVHVATTASVSPEDAAKAYWGAADVVDFAWLREALATVAGEDRWERRAVESLGAELERGPPRSHAPAPRRHRRGRGAGGDLPAPPRRHPRTHPHPPRRPPQRPQRHARRNHGIDTRARTIGGGVMILKVLVGFLLGFILGVAGAVFMVTSGAGNYIIAANPRVQELESKIRELEDQRSFMARRLEDVAGRSEQMARRFEELATRFESVARTSTQQAPAAPSGAGAPTPAD